MTEPVIIGNAEIYQGNCLDVLKGLRGNTVNCCVTSPPYYGLRDYGHEGQIGLEQTPDEYVAKLVEVFREVRRVLKTTGTLWLNLGDSYANDTYGQGGQSKKQGSNRGTQHCMTEAERYRGIPDGLKRKDLIGIPWRVAFALQADGWYLRQDIIWHKPNPMPESVKDRCTKSHEYLFLLSKQELYWYNAEAIKEPASQPRGEAKKTGQHKSEVFGHSGTLGSNQGEETRNRRSVWTVATRPYKGAHFATFPPALIEPCILAGCPEGGTVLDPFNGSGTTGEVALRHGRNYIGIELNPEYINLAVDRIGSAIPKQMAMGF